MCPWRPSRMQSVSFRASTCQHPQGYLFDEIRKCVLHACSPSRFVRQHTNTRKAICLKRDVNVSLASPHACSPSRFVRQHANTHKAICFKRDVNVSFASPHACSPSRFVRQQANTHNAICLTTDVNVSLASLTHAVRLVSCVNRPTPTKPFV